MSDEPENLMLVYLRRVDTTVSRIAEDVHDLKVRMTSLEEAVVGVQRRIDRIDGRLERVERRLGLLDPAIP